MKTFFILMTCGLLMSGCMTRRQTTSPQQEPEGRKAPTTDQIDKTGSGTDGDAPTPEVTGYGHDPGEETQE